MLVQLPQGLCSYYDVTAGQLSKLVSHCHNRYVNFYADRFVALAHRGAFPSYENSMRAFQYSYDLGYRYFESDVHATRDGVLIAFHDSSLDRVTDGRGEIKDLPYVQVAQARISDSEPIPLFEELVTAFPDVYFNIDIKSSNAIIPLAEICARYPEIAKRLCVTSFNPFNLRKFRRITFGKVTTSASFPGVIATRIGIKDSGPAVAYQVPVKYSGIEVVTPEFIDRAHSLGKAVHVWTINDRAEMKRLIDLGVDGLITDESALLKEVLMERGLWI